MYNANTNGKKAGVSTLTFSEVDCRTKHVTFDTEGIIQG